jgi:hypothetical protein
MRAVAVIIIILGLASLVFGILFTTQSVTARDEVAESIDPLPLDQLDAQYDQLKANIDQMKAAGSEPPIELTAKKTGLGLARSNVGTADFVRMNGLIDIIVGLGLALTGIALLRRLQSEAS